METSTQLCSRQKVEAQANEVPPALAAMPTHDDTTKMAACNPTPIEANAPENTAEKTPSAPLPNATIKTNAANASKSTDLKVTPLANANEITILSVDDDPINRMVLNGILKLHNYKVIEADNGETAIQKIQQHPEIDLVVLDVMMPRMTGYEACEILRKNRPMYDLPVIFLTAKDIESELTQGFISGGNDFVSKPVKKEELLARIKAQLTLLLHARELAKYADGENTVNTLDKIRRSRGL